METCMNGSLLSSSEKPVIIQLGLLRKLSKFLYKPGILSFSEKPIRIQIGFQWKLYIARFLQKPGIAKFSQKPVIIELGFVLKLCIQLAKYKQKPNTAKIFRKNMIQLDFLETIYTSIARFYQKPICSYECHKQLRFLWKQHIHNEDKILKKQDA